MASGSVVVPRLDIRQEDGPKVQMTQLEMNFIIDNVKLGISQETTKVRDQGLFDFELRSIRMAATVQDYESIYNFEIREMFARHLLARVPGGGGGGAHGVDLVLSDRSGSEDVLPMLKVKYTDVKKNSPDFVEGHKSTLKHVEVDFCKVHINFHQDAITDLMAKVGQLVEKLQKQAQNLISDDQDQVSVTRRIPDSSPANVPAAPHQNRPWRRLSSINRISRTEQEILRQANSLLNNSLLIRSDEVNLENQEVEQVL